MLEPDDIVLCEHGQEPDECSACRAEATEGRGSIFDLDAWLESFGLEPERSEHPAERV